MKGLYRYLSPFAPDQSGAVSILFELGGLIIIMDAGGCTGNTCGFDEPRWFKKKSAVYSAGLRDIDAIFGQDDKFLAKIQEAGAWSQASFIALIGTPVPSVIATDYKALAQLAEQATGLPTLYLETTGIEDYDKGEDLAYQEVLKMLKRGREDLAAWSGSLDDLSPAGRLAKKIEGERGEKPGIGIWGASPLDLPGPDSQQVIRDRAEKTWPDLGRAVTFGMDSSLADFYYASQINQQVLLSPSGLKPAQALEELGVPLTQGFLLEDGAGPDPIHGWDSQGYRALIIHQEVLAQSLQAWLTRLFPDQFAKIDTASFFSLGRALMGEGDFYLEGEVDLVQLVQKGHYDLVIGDPIFHRALATWPGSFVPAPHFAVSGGMYAPESDQAFYDQIYQGVRQALAGKKARP